MKKYRLFGGYRTVFLMVLSGMFLMAGCSKSGSSGGDPEGPPPVDFPYDTESPVRGSRIGWDYSTLERLCPLPGRTIQYSSYPRVKRLSDGSLACIYEVNQRIEFIRRDEGGSWSSPVTLGIPGYGMSYCVPELLELSDGTLLGMYNPRPTIEDPSRKFAIHTMRSTDGGRTWGRSAGGLRSFAPGDQRLLGACSDRVARRRDPALFCQ